MYMETQEHYIKEKRTSLKTTQEHYIKEKRTSLKTNDNIIVADPNSLNSGPTRKFCFFEQNISHPKRGKRPSHNFKNIFELF